MKALLFLLPLALAAQTVPVEISVNWPPAALVAQKYGPLPKAFVFGEVIGCSKGEASVVFGEGDVIAALRKWGTEGGLQAFSRQDAFSLVSNTQATSKRAVAIAWTKAAADSAIAASATGLIPGGTDAGLGLVLGATLLKVILPNVAGVLNLKQLITYSQDGLQSLMQIPAGRCTPPASVLFAVPATAPKQPVNAPAIFTIQIPVTK